MQEVQYKARYKPKYYIHVCRWESKICNNNLIHQINHLIFSCLFVIIIFSFYLSLLLLLLFSFCCLILGIRVLSRQVYPVFRYTCSICLFIQDDMMSCIFPLFSLFFTDNIKYMLLTFFTIIRLKHVLFYGMILET